MMQVRAETRVLIVDDHRAFADLLAASLDGEEGFSVVGIAATSQSATKHAARARPDLVIMDIRLGEQDGLATAREIRVLLPAVVIVVVSAHGGLDWVARAARAGANGYAPKSGSLSELLDVLRRSRLESMMVAASLHRGTGARRDMPAADLPALTDRESEVLVLLDRGVGPSEIAHILNITVNTCRGYVKSLHAKLGVGTNLEALAVARSRGLIGGGGAAAG